MHALSLKLLLLIWVDTACSAMCARSVKWTQHFVRWVAASLGQRTVLLLVLVASCQLQVAPAGVVPDTVQCTHVPGASADSN